MAGLIAKSRSHHGAAAPSVASRAMKNFLLWLVLALALFAAAFLFRRQTPVRTVPAPAQTRTAPPPLPARNLAAPPAPKPILPLEDGKTIDFSSGVPIVKDEPAEKAAIEKGVKEMEAALQGVTFGATAAPEAKKTESAKTPPAR
jgi:hypothetical protein